jgi:hypothetical protein
MKIALDDDGRIYAGRNTKELVRAMYHSANFNFDGSRNVREWMKGIAERSKPTKISTKSEQAFFRDGVKAGYFKELDQGSKVQP